MNRHPSRARRRRGSALMLVIVATSMVLSAWAIANHRTNDLLRLKDLQAQRVSGRLATISDTTPATRPYAFEAACIGLAHLEVAAPPQQADSEKKKGQGGAPLSYSAFKCTIATEVYVVKFTFDNTTSLWTIDVIASDLWDGPPALDELTELSQAF